MKNRPEYTDKYSTQTVQEGLEEYYKINSDLTKHMGLIPHRHTVEELGWGLNPHPNSSLQPSAFCLQPFFNKSQNAAR
ncbi:MAG: hypothetical protein AAF349_15955 [Cyanobacteria bacterium P01_A01_bin.68]